MPTALKSDMKSTTKSQWTLGDSIGVKGEHHESIKALWETKWRFPVDDSHGFEHCRAYAVSSARKVSIRSTTASSKTLSKSFRR